MSERMHTTRSPSSIPSGVSGDALDLSLSGSQLSMSHRPSSASPGKYLCRSVSVSVPGDSRGKRNTLSDASYGSSRSIKNLRRSNSTTQVNQPAGVPLSQDQNEDYLSLFDSSADGRKKLASLSKASPDRTTWNILDDQPRAFPLHSSSRSTGSMDSPTGPKRREAAIALAATFTANNRSNKGAVGNSVTTMLHNNYSEKPLTPKSSNQRPSFNNILKATANDEDNSSLTKSQKNFLSTASASNNRCPSQRSSPVPSGRREVTEEEAERFIQQVNQAAVTIQRWYRRHVSRRHTNQAALRRVLASKRKEWEERTEEDSRLEQRQKKDEDRKGIREEKARLARLAAIQELQHRRAQQAEGGGVARRKPPRICGPASPSNHTDSKAKNTDSNLNVSADLAEPSVPVVSPSLSNHRSSQCSQDQEDRVEEQSDRKAIGKEREGLARPAATQELQHRRAQQAEGGGVARRKPPRICGPASPSNHADSKARNTDSNLNAVAELGELSGFRAVSPAVSTCRASQRSGSVEDQRQGAQGKSTLNELLDTLKLLEEEPERLREATPYSKDKYAWIDEDGDSNSLTTDNLERHGQLAHHPALPDGGALLSEAKLQSIMSFLDEMEKSEQERPRSATSGSHREAVMSEEELGGVEHASAAAAEIGGSVMRIKLELEEKKRSVNMLQSALAQQRELTLQHVKETEKELSRSFQLQKDQYEATIQRHLSFIDQLISDKRSLSERCEAVLGQLQQVDHKYTRKMAEMQQQHDVVWQILGPLCEEIKKLKDLMSATEKVRREKWIDEKTKKIKEITVKGLEPEIHKMISKHKQELKKLRTLHEAELLQADERAGQRYLRQCEELRQQLDREKEEQCQRERQLARQSYEKQLQEEELSLQQQRRRLYKEVADEKDRLAQLAARQRAELEELREELDRSREEQERRHQEELKALQERLDTEKHTWEENYKRKEEVWLLSRERELKEELRRERDKEIELAIWTLEEETSRDKEECERTADNRVKRVREKYEVELVELQRSEREAVEKQQELRRQQLDMEAELISLQAALRHKEKEAEDVTQIRDKLMEERRSLADVIRQEFAERLVMTEEENRRMKTEVSEGRARLRLEVERVTREKEEELAEVHQRVKAAILKKEETLSNLRAQHEAALKRAEHLQALWEQQRKQLLEK